MLNKQEVFDRITKHLLTQNKQALLNGGDYPGPICQYKTKKGLKCAIGCLIDDSLLDKAIEGTIYNPEVQNNVCKSLGLLQLSSLEVDFLRSLQKIHDACSPLSWETELKQIAKNNYLTFNGVTNG